MIVFKSHSDGDNARCNLRFIYSEAVADHRKDMYWRFVKLLQQTHCSILVYTKDIGRWNEGEIEGIASL